MTIENLQNVPWYGWIFFAIAIIISVVIAAYVYDALDKINEDKREHQRKVNEIYKKMKDIETVLIDLNFEKIRTSYLNYLETSNDLNNKKEVNLYDTIKKVVELLNKSEVKRKND